MCLWIMFDFLISQQKYGGVLLTCVSSGLSLPVLALLFFPNSRLLLKSKHSETVHRSERVLWCFMWYSEMVEQSQDVLRPRKPCLWCGSFLGSHISGWGHIPSLCPGPFLVFLQRKLPSAGEGCECLGYFAHTLRVTVQIPGPVKTNFGL